MTWFGGIVKAPPELLPEPSQDDRPQKGCFAEVVSGPHEGRYGVYVADDWVEGQDFPEHITIRTRDENEDHIIVNFRDARPSEPGRR
jgi:hypothetical protein